MTGYFVTALYRPIEEKEEDFTVDEGQNKIKHSISSHGFEVNSNSHSS